MAGGRPTDYTPELLEKAKQYIYVPEAFGRANGDIPNLAGFALYLGISRPTVYEWAKEHKEFSYIVDDILAEQEQMLLQKGLKGEYQPTIAKLMLTKHGYTDKQDITSDGKALPTPILGNVNPNEKMGEGH